MKEPEPNLALPSKPATPLASDAAVLANTPPSCAASLPLEVISPLRSEPIDLSASCSFNKVRCAGVYPAV